MKFVIENSALVVLFELVSVLLVVVCALSICMPTGMYIIYIYLIRCLCVLVISFLLGIDCLYKIKIKLAFILHVHLLQCSN